MAILLKIVLVRVSSIQIMQIRVQNKGKRVWKNRYVGDVSMLSPNRTQYRTKPPGMVRPRQLSPRQPQIQTVRKHFSTCSDYGTFSFVFSVIDVFLNVLKLNR